MVIPKSLLQAASRDDCSPQTLYDLRDAVEESEQDWIQALPIFLKHLSFPLHPPPYPEDDAPEHPLDTLARSALFPILGVLRRFKPAGSTLPTAVVRAAPDIWRWLSRWTCAAFLANGELATSRMHIFEHVLQAVNALTPHQDLVVVEAFDVVVTHFCLAGRSKRLQTIVDAVGQKLGSALSNAVETAALGYDMVVQHLKLVAQSIFHKSVGQHLIGPSALLVALLQCSEEILHHGCIYLDLRHRDNREPLRRATLSNSYSLMLIFQVITAIDPAKISVLPESLLRRTLASVLRVYHSVIRLAADTASVFHSDGELRSLCDVCCDILLSVIAGQQSVLRSCALLHWALRNGMLQAIVQTPAHGAGDTVKAEVAVELGRPEFDFDGPKHVLDMVVLPRMWCLSVYEAVAESIKTAPCASASLLLGRWAGVHSLTIDRMLPLKSTCNHRLCVNRDSNTRRRRCAGCMHAYFCSPSCQRASWRAENHRCFCKPFISRKNVGLLPTTGAESVFMSLVVGTELKVKEHHFKRGLQRSILGAGSQLEARFNENGAQFRVGQVRPAEVSKQHLETLWGDVFRQQAQDHTKLVLVRIFGGQLEDGQPNLWSSVMYSVAYRPSWLPLAL